MDTQEFYIRHASETDARGPYNLEEMVSLAETGSVTVETLYYDATTERWAVIGDNPASIRIHARASFLGRTSNDRSEISKLLACYFGRPTE